MSQLNLLSFSFRIIKTAWFGLALILSGGLLASCQCPTENPMESQPRPMVVVTGPSNVNENTTITLSGSNITSETILSYQWEQISPANPTAQIKSPTASSTEVILPYLKNINLSEPFVFQLTVVGTGGANSTKYRLVVTSPANIDSDGDGLIDIRSLLMLHDMRYNLAGTSYKTNDSDTGLTSGCPSDTCIGYELLASLNFDKDGDGRTWTWTGSNDSYPLDSGDSQAPYFVTDEGGWHPIGDESNPFVTTFDGNGHTITGLAIRRDQTYIGFFGKTDTGANIRNVGLLENLADYTGSSDSSKFIGGLVGQHSGSIVASYTTGLAEGGEGNFDNVGGLVGLIVDQGKITTSYATGKVHGRGGGGNDEDNIGGLVGQHGGSIVGSYATSDVYAGEGGYDFCGGLIGFYAGGTTIASYADRGHVFCGTGFGDWVGSLIGGQVGSVLPVVASYGFGYSTVQNDVYTSSGTILIHSDWTSITPGNYQTAERLTSAIVNDPNDLPGNPDDNKWDSASENTKDAWDFGTSNQIPALKYADYDGVGTVFHCESDAANAPTGAILIANCGELIPGQR